MLHSNHYQKDRAFRSDRMREVQREHLAEKVSNAPSTSLSQRAARLPRRVIALVVIIGVLVMATLLPGTIQAHGAEEDTGILEPFAQAVADYRVGHYHFVAGDYEQAVTQYQRAISQIPAAMIAANPDYMAIYWDLGDAQQMAGYYDDALISYQLYLELVGDEASEQAVAYVASLQDALTSSTTFEVALLSG